MTETAGEIAGVPAWDRFARWPQGLARAALLALAVLLVLCAWAPGMKSELADAPDLAASAKPTEAPPASGEKDNDLRLYRLITERVAAGENYYQAATEQQRASGYPVAPGLTVRLPTLALISARVGQGGLAVLGVALLLGALAANYRRFAGEGDGSLKRIVTGLLLISVSANFRLEFAVLHELWLAGLLALSFGLHRPEQGRWIGAWLAAAAALAIRELALPYVLLMAAFALWHRRWREGAAWSALALVFGVALACHLQAAESFVRPGDPHSPPWLVFGGLGGMLYKLIHSSVLNVLPQVLAGPLVVLGIFGWCGWRSGAGAFASLLLLGYALAFMIAGRDNNFYWGVTVVPILFMGLAFAPFSLASLARRANG